MSDQFTYKIFRKFDQELGNLWISFEKNKNYFFLQKIEYIKKFNKSF